MKNLSYYAQPDQLERNSFLWSQVRLVIAAVALFIGGYPPVLKYNPFPGLYGPISSLLTVSWIISGLAAAYLVYRWYTGGQQLFGGRDPKDKAAFAVMIVSGLNLGLAALLKQNIGMSISSNYGIFVIVGLLYLVSAYHLYQRWNESGQKLL